MELIHLYSTIALSFIKNGLIFQGVGDYFLLKVCKFMCSYGVMSSPLKNLVAFFIGTCKNCNFPVVITRTVPCYEQVGSSTMLCYEQEGPCWKAGLIPVYPVVGMIHSKRADRKNLDVQTLRT